MLEGKRMQEVGALGMKLSSGVVLVLLESQYTQDLFMSCTFENEHTYTCVFSWKRGEGNFFPIHLFLCSRWQYALLSEFSLHPSTPQKPCF